jgi:SAM-dependent methyltransferase
MNKTIDYYDNNAELFISGTRDIDFTYTQDKFLSYLNEGDLILDFGCGSGRDTKYFLSKGFKVEATDGSKEICKYASEYTGIEVKQLLFEDLDEVNKYDGIWACSSILHCDHDSLMKVMGLIHRALKDDGILYTSFKYSDFEGERKERHFIDLTEETIKPYIEDYELIEQWISCDARPGRQDEKWLNIIVKKK